MGDAPTRKYRGATEEEKEVCDNHGTLAYLGRNHQARPTVTIRPRITKMAKMNKNTGEGGVQSQGPGESQTLTQKDQLAYERASDSDWAMRK